MGWRGSCLSEPPALRDVLRDPVPAWHGPGVRAPSSHTVWSAADDPPPLVVIATALGGILQVEAVWMAPTGTMLNRNMSEVDRNGLGLLEQLVNKLLFLQGVTLKLVFCGINVRLILLYSRLVSINVIILI